eukprot:334196_1
MRKHLAFISDLLFQPDYDGIKLQQILTIFPNCNYINIHNIELSDAFFENMAHEMAANSIGTDVKLPWIFIEEIKSPETKHGLSVQDAVCKYSATFLELGAFLYADGNYDSFTRLFISSGSKIQSACFCFGTLSESDLDMFSEAIFVGEDMQAFISKLVTKRLSKMDHERNDEKEFDEWCHSVRNVIITLRHVNDGWRSNFRPNAVNSYLFTLFAHPKIDTWIRIDALNDLFPNLQYLSFGGIDISIEMIEDILRCTFNLRLKSITLDFRKNIVDNRTVKDQILQQSGYVTKFAQLNWSVSSGAWGQLIIARK